LDFPIKLKKVNFTGGVLITVETSLLEFFIKFMIFVRKESKKGKNLFYRWIFFLRDFTGGILVTSLLEFFIKYSIIIEKGNKV